MHGGVKFYRGSAAAARSYVEADRSRVDDYYLAEGTGVATRYVATAPPAAGGRGIAAVQDGGTLDGDAYERWVAGYDVETGAPKGRLRTDERGLRFVEVVVNGPKTWSLAATLHPEIAAAYDAAQDRAAVEIIGWLAEHATTRVGPRGRQVQVPVEQLEAAVVRHYTSRAGDPHRHLHLQINARVFAAGAWRGLHSVGRGGQHRGHQRDRARRRHVRPRVPPRARGPRLHASTPTPARSPSSRRTPVPSVPAPRRSPGTSTATKPSGAASTPGRSPARRCGAPGTVAPGRQPGPTRSSPKTAPSCRRRWVEELHELGFTPPAGSDGGREARYGDRQGQPGRGGRPRPVPAGCTPVEPGTPPTSAARSNAIVASLDIVAPTPVRRELAEDLTARTVAQCEPLLDRGDVPEHVRALTSQRVLDVEADLVTRLVARAEHVGAPDRVGHVVAGRELDPAQRAVVAALAGDHQLVVIEGAAGAGKTTTLAAARDLLEMQHRRLVVVTPTLKAARVAEQQVGTDAFSAAWLIHQHGYRWDDDGHWSRVETQPDRTGPAAARRRPARRRGRHARPGHRPRPAHHRRPSPRPGRVRR